MGRCESCLERELTMISDNKWDIAVNNFDQFVTELSSLIKI